MVACQHDDPDAGAATGGDRGRNLRSRRIVQAHQPKQHRGVAARRAGQQDDAFAATGGGGERVADHGRRGAAACECQHGLRRALDVVARRAVDVARHGHVSPGRVERQVGRARMGGAQRCHAHLVIGGPYSQRDIDGVAGVAVAGSARVIA